MDAPTILYALRWLIHDTFRQTIMSRVMVIMLGLSTMCIVFCLGVSIEGGAVQEEREHFHPKTGKLLGPGETAGKMSLMFGLMTTDFGRTAEQEVRFIMNIFASWVAGIVGVLMALVWTAGFIPEALQPSAASVLLAKPAPRWLFLAGKYLGVVAFIALHVAFFFAGTWLALGLKTNVWTPQYLLGIPLLVLHFAVVYAFSVMLAVLFRSTMACVVGTVIFWLICFGINYGHDFVTVYAELNPNGPQLSPLSVFLTDLGYWMLPKPIDFTIMLEKSLNLGDTMVALESRPPFKNVIANDEFHPLFAIFSSCGFAVVALWGAASQLANTDY